MKNQSFICFSFWLIHIQIVSVWHTQVIDKQSGFVYVDWQSVGLSTVMFLNT